MEIIMLRYFGRITMNEQFTRILNIAQDLMGLIESVYAENIESEVFSITINDEFIVGELKKAETEWERNEIIQKCKELYPHYEKKLFNRLLADFCMYMDESLRCIVEFKPHIAYTLARKPLIDDIFYLQYLFLKPIEVIDLIFLDIAKAKDVGTKENKKIDEEHSCEIAQKIGFSNNIFKIRYDDSEYSILHNCNKAMHISTCRSRVSITKSGELNFIFMEDNEIEAYTKLYLDTVPLLLFYVGIITIKISEKINGEDKFLSKKMSDLQEKYAQIIQSIK